MASTISTGDANRGFQAGIINGPVYTTFNSPPDRRETPPYPSAVLPFGRDPDFVDRGTLLDQIRKKNKIPASRTALVGVGGVGKSQLAIEYCYRTVDNTPQIWVFWVHASNAARFEQGFRDIADQAKIAGRQDPQVNIFKLVHNWLCSSKQQWLLVLDNVDDARFILEGKIATRDQSAGTGTAARPLREYLPYCNHGSILVTSRSNDAVLKLVEQRDIISVKAMDGAEGLELCMKKLGAHEDSDSVAKLVALLEYMPLAIVQATTYISQRSPRYSVAQYLEKFQRSDDDKGSLLNYEGGQLRRDWEANNSVIITWQISFEHLRRTKPSAADLLSLMSFFDRQGIPESLLKNRGEATRGNTDSIKQERSARQRLKHLFHRTRNKSMGAQQADSRFEDDVIALRDLCFISVAEDGATFEMHSLIQLATRTWLAANGELEIWKQQFISNLDAAFPNVVEYENWTACQALFAHAKSAADQKQPESETSLQEWAGLLHRASYYALRKGYAAEAKTLAFQSMEVRKSILGREHEATLQSQSLAARACVEGGELEVAEELQKEVTEICKESLDTDDLVLLLNMVNLAQIYGEQERWDAAEELEVRALESYKKKLGVDHQVTLNAMGNLAVTYSKQGLVDAAEELEVQVLEAYKKNLGADHLDTLIFMGNLAATYKNQGRWDESEALQVQVLEARKRKLGVNHPSTLISMGLLALTYEGQGRLAEAEALQVQTFETSKMKLGVDHPDTLKSMYNLADTWATQGRTTEALQLARQCVQLGQHCSKPDHPWYRRFLSFLAELERTVAEVDTT